MTVFYRILYGFVLNYFMDNYPDTVNKITLIGEYQH